MADSLGTALYFEMRRGPSTSQIIITPQIFNPVTEVTQKPNILTRQISATTPKRAWRYYEFVNVPVLEKTEDMERTFANLNLILSEASPFLVGYVSGGWLIVERPLAIEVSLADLDDIAATKTPAAFIRRMLRSRAEAGYPNEVLVGGAPATVPAY
jgi:hypothetical protein